MSGLSAHVHSSVKVEEVSALIIPAPGVKLTDAIKDANPDGINEMLVNPRENHALLSIFKRKPIQPSIEFIDGVLYFRCPVPKGAPTIAFNLERDVVIGKIRTIVVFDTNEKREWARSFFAPGLDLSPGGILTIEQQKKE